MGSSNLDQFVLLGTQLYPVLKFGVLSSKVIRNIKSFSTFRLFKGFIDLVEQ